MDPVAILAWIILGGIGLVVVFVVLSAVVGIYIGVKITIKHYMAYLKTRNVEIKTGQIWGKGNVELRLTVWESSHITVHSGNCSVPYSPEQWKRRVKNQRLTLIKDVD